MENSFVDDIKKKTSLVKFVINTDTASDIISYLYKETERQKVEIEQIKNKLAESNCNNSNNQDKYSNLFERINELAIEMNKKFEESNSRTNNLINEKIKDINLKTDFLSKKIGTSEKYEDLYLQLNLLRNELQSLKKNTSEFIGVKYEELNKTGTSRSSNLEKSNHNSDSESDKNILNSPNDVERYEKDSSIPLIPISKPVNNETESKKDFISLQELANQVNQLREEINQQKELNSKINTNRSSSRPSSHLKKKEKDPIIRQKKILKDAEVEVKINISNEKEVNKSDIKGNDGDIKGKNKDINPDLNKDTNTNLNQDINNSKNNDKSKEEKIDNDEKNVLKYNEITLLQEEIGKLKQMIDNQTEQLNKIQKTSTNGQISLDDYIQEILQSAMKCDSESQKLTNDYKNLQNLLINSLQEIKERMDSMSDQFTDMATKEEVMAAFAEIINPKPSQNGTSIGVSKCKCKCLACGRTKPSVVSTTDSNLAEILHFHPLNRNEAFRPGAKVTLLKQEQPITSRLQNGQKEIITPRRPKTSRS